MNYKSILVVILSFVILMAYSIHTYIKPMIAKIEKNVDYQAYSTKKLMDE